MKLTGLHFLLTYQCNFACDHCFVWGSPRQTGVMTLPHIRLFLQQAVETGTIKSVAFEGGEPFLYYATLLEAVRLAASMGFAVSLVSNAYWATDVEDAVAYLRPFAGLIQSLSVSSDLYHYDEQTSRQARNALAAAEQAGITARLMSIALAGRKDAPTVVGELPPGETGVMYRGRAAVKLAPRHARKPWDSFTTCPHENLREPGRVHLDPLGNLHICQGIVIGNLFETPLRDICAAYDPAAHPVVAPLLDGGPAELARRYGLAGEEGYVDACHMCYTARLALRQRFPAALRPDQMYGAN
ncbi:MAG: radical SAM protein [Chloroflexi bacterium]|nr:radical SAM protein [Chloroflexota bacterium]